MIHSSININGSLLKRTKVLLIFSVVELLMLSCPQLVQVVIYLVYLLLPEVDLSGRTLSPEVLIHGEFLDPVTVQLNR